MWKNCQPHPRRVHCCGGGTGTGNKDVSCWTRRHQRDHEESNGRELTEGLRKAKGRGVTGIGMSSNEVSNQETGEHGVRGTLES